MRLRFSRCHSVERYLEDHVVSRRALALDLPPALKSQRVNQLSSHPRMPRPDFTGVNNEEQDKGAAEEGERKGEGKGYEMSIGDFCNFLLLVLGVFFGENEGYAGVKTPRKGTHEDYPLFAVQYARSLSFSRLARRESTACFSESSP